MEYRASRYNFEVEEKDGSLLLYNTSSGGVLLIDDPGLQKQAMQALREGLEGEVPESLESLKEGGFLIPIEVDEREAIFHRFQNAVKNQKQFELCLLPTEDCNFRCRYCYESFRKLHMSPKVVQKIVRLFDEKTENMEKVRIGWFGGEPLLGIDSILQLSQVFNDIVGERNITNDVHITTNGYLLSPDNAEKLISLGINKFHITLDGPEEIHDKLRHLKNGKGTFRRIVDNLLHLKKTKQKFQVLIRCSFDRNTHQCLRRFLFWFDNNFGRDERFSIYFTGIHPSGTKRDNAFDFCSNAEIALVNLQLRKSALQYRLTKLYQEMPIPVDIYCSAVAQNAIIVGADGTLWKCTEALNQQDAVGKLDPKGKELHYALYYKWLNLNYRNDEVCWNCRLLPLCQGSCPLVRKKGKRACLYSEGIIRELLMLSYEEYLRKTAK